MRSVMFGKAIGIVRRSPSVRGGVFILILLIGLLLGHAALVSYRSTLVDFEPWPAEYDLQHPEKIGIQGLQEVTLRTPAGAKVSGWFVPGRNHAAVIIAHGTNADRLSMLAELRDLAAAGFGVFALDWPGHGESEGAIQWGANERAALTTVIDWLALRKDVDTTRIGGLGFSFGGVIMAQVAAVDPRLSAVVLEATPTSYDDYERWLRRRWGWFSEMPASFALRNIGFKQDFLAPDQAVASISPRPLLIIGGANDPVVPPDMINRLYASARGPKEVWMVPSAMHGGYAQTAPLAYSDRLVGFFTTGLHIAPMG